MEVKTLLRLIKEDIAHLEGITKEYLWESPPSSDEVELALVRAKALLRELELLYKIANQHENSSENTKSEESFGISQKISIAEKKIPEDIKQDEPTDLGYLEPITNESAAPTITKEVQITEEATVQTTMISQGISDQTGEMPTGEFNEIKKTLGETLGEPQQVVNDILSPDIGESGYQLSPIKSIWDGIGINDRFLFIRELFDNSSSKFETTITDIDRLEVIQDAVSYLKMNFKWNKTESSQKFLALVKRRFTK